MSKEEMKIQKQLRRSMRVGIETGRGKTEQAHKKQCDINYILRDYYANGMIKHAKTYEGRYDDISVESFQDAMFKVKQAEQMFADLPSNLRKEFGQDPASFLAFVQDPANGPRMREMGILKGNDGIDITGAATGAPVPQRDDSAGGKAAGQASGQASEKTPT